MNAIITNGTPEEIAALALAVQRQQTFRNVKFEIDGVELAKSVIAATRGKIPED